MTLVVMMIAVNLWKASQVAAQRQHKNIFRSGALCEPWKILRNFCPHPLFYFFIHFTQQLFRNFPITSPQPFSPALCPQNVFLHPTFACRVLIYTFKIRSGAMPTILVTGANRGIGLEFLLQLHSGWMQRPCSGPQSRNATDIESLGISLVLLSPSWAKTDMGADSAAVSAESSVSGMEKILHAARMVISGKF
jgi:hypothetical protein